ncbi:MAG: GIY-YIG nuclease family protein [Bacteroidota bacterium]
MHYIYILYSPSSDSYYVGETSDIAQRLEQHNNKLFEGAYTVQANDWQLFWSYACENSSLARKIEMHIKQMKSRKYYADLKLYPEIIEKLTEKYSK